MGTRSNCLGGQLGWASNNVALPTCLFSACHACLTTEVRTHTIYPTFLTHSLRCPPSTHHSDPKTQHPHPSPSQLASHPLARVLLVPGSANRRALP